HLRTETLTGVWPPLVQPHDGPEPGCLALAVVAGMAACAQRRRRYAAVILDGIRAGSHSRKGIPL
ncbi:MAG: hypothetical protein KDA37_11455, partial [Planctomycetales bacterium]|nr:hypothetical protein [Planctomycetales bacterium]